MSDSCVHSNDNVNEILSVCAGMPSKDDDAGYRGVSFTDGSHGVQYVAVSQENKLESHSICMPSPCALGGSFDRQLLHQVGKAIGSMAADGGYNAVLSPDVSIVRSPLYGGSANCFSEDPYVCGVLGSEWVGGVQSVGTAAVLRNFAGANQSRGKFTCDSIIDKRALHEIYLRPFEMTVKLSQPHAAYCGFNKINGLECGENSVLLTDILRNEWKFDGAVLADMRLSCNCAASMAAGVNMSYPSGGARVKHRLKRAVEREEIPRHYPKLCAKRVTEAFKSREKSCCERMNEEECRKLALTAAEQCAVLIKNHKNTLPLPLSSSIALIGPQAQDPRIQRGGINALHTDKVKNMLNVFDENNIRYKYCKGFDDDAKTNDELLSQAVKCAAKSDFAMIFVGFDDTYDNGSTDRATNQLPRSQVKLINSIAKVNSNTVVIVNGSALPKLNWIGRVKAVLYMPLCGEKMCEAVFNLLFGFANPCGRLAVSYSLNEADMPCGDTFGNNKDASEYRESIYVGYRYYNKAGIHTAFPFGYGLSYTRFEYSKMKASKCSEGWKISLNVKNIGKRDGAEIVQIYIEAPKTEKFRPIRELKQFYKVFLAKGEERTISMILPREAFACYNAEFGRFRVTSGRYRVCAAASSSDIRSEVWISVKGENPLNYNVPAWYTKPSGRPKESDFHKLFGKKIEAIQPLKTKKYDISCTLNELKDIAVFGFAVRCVKKFAYIIIQPESSQHPEYSEQIDLILNMPVNRLCGLCHGLYPMKLTKLIIKTANIFGGKTK